MSEHVSAGEGVGAGGPHDGRQHLPSPWVKRLAALVEATTVAGSGRLQARAILALRRAGSHGGRLRVGVLGEFNRGKSTLLNALVGRRALPAGVLPTTRAPVLLCPAGPEGWWWRLAPAPGDEAERRVACADGPEAATAARAVASPAPGSLLELGVDADWGEHLELLDTPGLADPHFGAADGGLVDWLFGCDLLLLTLDAGQPLTDTELRFAAEWLAPRGPRRVHVVLNRADLPEPEDLAAIRAHVVSALPASLQTAPLFVCAPRQALRATDPGTDELRVALDTLQGERLTELRRLALGQETESLSQAVARELDLVHAALMLEPAELRRLRTRAAERRAQGSETRQELRRRLQAAARRERERLDDGLERLRERLGDALPEQLARASPRDLQRYLADFLRDTFAAWAERHASGVADRLQQLSEELTALQGEWLRQVTLSALEPVGLSRPATPWEVHTPLGDGGVVALGAAGTALAVLSGLGVGALVALAAPALASLVQLGRGHRVRQLALEHSLSAVAELSAATRSQLTARNERALAAMELYFTTAGAPLQAAVDEVLSRVGALGGLPDEQRGAKLGQVLAARQALSEAWPDALGTAASGERGVASAWATGDAAGG